MVAPAAELSGLYVRYYIIECVRQVYLASGSSNRWSVLHMACHRSDSHNVDLLDEETMESIIHPHFPSHAYSIDGCLNDLTEWGLVSRA